jgi:hypothetical protein
LSARPAAKMFLAAFTSRSWIVPHAGHVHWRTLSGFGPSFTPQAEHTWLVGSNRPTLANDVVRDNVARACESLGVP